MHVYSLLLLSQIQNAIEKAAEGIEKKFDQTQKDIQILQQRIAQLSTGGGGGATADSAKQNLLEFY